MNFAHQACARADDGFKVRLVSLAKRLLIAALATVIWLFAPSARAAAPRCDIRAAITFGAAPTLDTPVSSIDIGENDCTPPSPLDALAQGRSQTQLVFSAVPDLALTSTDSVAPAAEVGALARPIESSTAPSGARSSLDRPPRK
jgi:hypothetical protein